MRVPTWWSWQGLGIHAGVGAAVTAACWLGGAAGWVPVVLALGLGVWHEWADGDLTTAPGAPWNGVVDVLAFLPGPVGYALGHWGRLVCVIG